MKGYAGKILHVNLNLGEISEKPLKPDIAKDFLGGYGIGAKYLYEHMPPNADPLGKESIIGFISGPLNNTWALYGGRYTVVCKSPVTGGWNDANSGGTFGSKMKKAGVDAVFVEGIADNPVYIFVSNGKAEILDASDLWGHTAKETEEILRKCHGKKIGIALIGPGGENGSYFSAVMNDEHRAAARGGPGAVMGSKNLKALVVKGSKRTKVAHPIKILRNNITSLLALLKSQRTAKKLFKQGDESAEGAAFFTKHGTGGFYVQSVMTNDAGIKNFAEAPGESYSKEDAEAISSKSLEKYKTKKYCCPQCHVACCIFIDVHTKKWGKIKNTTRPEYETMATLGSMLLNKDVDSIIKMNEMCNEYGLDTISAGSVLAWAMECYEKEIFTKDDLDGIELKWGDGEAAVNLLRKICKNKGIGQVLKLGSKAAADKLGKGHECLVVCGGIEEPQHDARFLVGLGSTYMADPTPGRHVKASLSLTSQDADFDPEISLQGLGLENILSIVDCEIMNCCGACAFGFGDGNKNDAIIKNIMAVTGNEYSRADIIRLGVRIFTMRQLFNAREGIGRAELSERVYKGKPPFKGTLADIDLDFNKVVDELYDALGWSRDGVPSNGALKTLGLGYLNRTAPQ